MQGIPMTDLLQQNKVFQKMRMANEMYKTAFCVKKNKFAQEAPQLSEKEILEKTKKYFLDLPKD
jgi:hypothetical protein